MASDEDKKNGTDGPLADVIHYEEIPAKLSLIRSQRAKDKGNAAPQDMLREIREYLSVSSTGKNLFKLVDEGVVSLQIEESYEDDDDGEDPEEQKYDLVVKTTGETESFPLNMDDIGEQALTVAGILAETWMRCAAAEKNWTVDGLLLCHRHISALTEVLKVRIACDLREDGEDEMWAAIKSSHDDIAKAYENAPAGIQPEAWAHAQWFMVLERRNKSDENALSYAALHAYETDETREEDFEEQDAEDILKAFGDSALTAEAALLYSPDDDFYTTGTSSAEQADNLKRQLQSLATTRRARGNSYTP